MNQLSNKGENMKAEKHLVVCLTVCLIVSFVSAVYAASPETRGSAPVTVVNSVSKPIPVTEVKQQPIQREVTVKICGFCGLNCAPGCSGLSRGHLAVANLYNVPLNRRLVIEYFSCRNGNMGTYGTAYACSITTSVSDQRVEHWLPTTLYGHPETPDIDSLQPMNPPAFISAGQKVQIYAGPGTDVSGSVFRSKNTLYGTSSEYNGWTYNYDEYMSFSFSGYLVDITQQVVNQ
jgi:hypothetical protein